MAIDMEAANDIAQQLMHHIHDIQATTEADNGTWISALMQLTASFVVNADPVSTRTIERVFGLYVERAQAVRLAQHQKRV